jgi:hypothetical protein
MMRGLFFCTGPGVIVAGATFGQYLTSPKNMTFENGVYLFNLKRKRPEPKNKMTSHTSNKYRIM